MTTPLKCVVIGAGICGLSTAIWLRRAGHEVTLIDRDHPGAGASFGNAGLLAQWAMVPVNTPGLAMRGLKYLLNPKAPLYMQWSALPQLVPWLWKFLRYATPKGTDHMAHHLATIVTDSVDQHRALVAGTRAEQWITDSAFSFAYPNRAAFEADKLAWDYRAQNGMVPDLIEGGAVQEEEPLLAPHITCLAQLKGHGHVLNPGAYMQTLAQVLTDEGGTYLQAEAMDIVLDGGKVTGVATDHGLLPCDHAILTAGIWSKPLMKKLGVNVSMVAERGYHLHLKNPSAMPRNPMMITDGKFGVNPMSDGIRCAGTVELGDANAPPSRAPLDLIAEHVKRAFPDLTFDHAEEWIGFRPSTPDSLPLIGEIGQTGVYAGFGHQHIGLTAGPKTGRLLAAQISGQAPNIDMSAYDANRFSR